jgi:predicted outer membrane repeat protein
MGDTALNGGGLAIESGAAVHLQDARVTDNVAAGARGIWAASGGALTALDTAVTGNGSGGYGGGMIVNGMAVMQNVEIGGNDAARWGGGVDLDLGGSLTLINATVHGNTAGSGAGGGGGVDAWIGTLDVNASTFTGNAAAGRGGAIYMSADSDSLSPIANSILAGNSAGSVVEGHEVLLAGRDLNFDATIPGAEARNTGGAQVLASDKALVLADEGIGLGDVFAAIDAATGGGLVHGNGGAVGTAALKLEAANVAIAGDGGAFAPADPLDLDGDGDGDTAEDLPDGADGAPRD